MWGREIITKHFISGCKNGGRALVTPRRCVVIPQRPRVIDEGGGGGGGGGADRAAAGLWRRRPGLRGS